MMDALLRDKGGVGPWLLGGFLLGYLALGAYTESQLGAALLQDFMHYQSALARFAAGESPYAVQHIGLGFLYPLPALFIVEAFSFIKPFSLLAAAYIGFNIALVAAMVYGLSRHYGLGLRQVWWWYPLCLGFAPFLETLHIGQINAITLFGIFILFVGAARSPALSGAGLCLAALTKTSPLLFFIWLAGARRYRAALAAVVAIALVSALAAARYGLGYALEYPAMLQWLTETFPRFYHAHSLAAHLWRLNDWLPGMAALEFAVREPVPIQRLLGGYLLALILASGALTWMAARRGAAEPEPLFIVIALGMTVYPNILWYHHWVFILLPLLVWMAWARLHPLTVGWCLLGLLVAQGDRVHPPHGLLIHLYCHLSLWLVLAWQLRQLRARASSET